MAERPAPDVRRYPLERAAPRGFDMAYVREGRGGVPLLLIHGWPETLRIWWRNLEPLAAAGFEVVAPDLRGFGKSGLAPDRRYDLAAHSRDLHALVHDQLGIRRVSVVAGDLGGAVAQDLSLRFPGFVERLVVFNCPLPYLRESMASLDTRPPAESADYFLRQGRDADALAAELDTPERRRAYVAGFYGPRRWAHPGSFSPAEVDFMTEPFADAAKLRAGFGNYEAALSAEARSEPPLFGVNPTPATILFGTSDRVIYPDFDRMAECVFPDHRDSLRVPQVGHFLQWEAAELLHRVVALRCRDEDPPGAPEETAYVGLGSNLGERERQLQQAFSALRATPGVRDVVASPIYETDPVGPGEQGPYLNGVARLRTVLEPRALLARLLTLEREAGRRRGPERNAPRTLDLDLLLHGRRLIEEPDLELPHPRLAARPFVLEPLADLAPDLVHPGAGQTIAALARRVRDPAAVRRR